MSKKLPLRARIPKSDLGLNRRAVITSVGIISFLSILITINSLKSTGSFSKEPMARHNWSAVPNEAVMSLPSSYEDRNREVKKLIRKETLSNSLKDVKISNKKELTKEEKYLEDLRLKRLKLAQSAKTASVSFTDIEIDPDSIGAETESDTDLIYPVSKYEVKAGSIIPGFLLSGINSDLPGKILGQVSENIYDSVSGRYLLIPQGTKLIGTYDNKIQYGQNRVFISWDRLIYPNGNAVNLEDMPGADGRGYSGLSDTVNHHYERLAFGVVLGSILSSGTQIAGGNSSSAGQATFGQLALQGAAQNVSRAGEKITERNLEIPPTIEVRPGVRFTVFVTRDLKLVPFTRN